jgi:amino acid permease
MNLTDKDVFVALCKSYCAINILILPKNFANGGWLVGIIAICLGGCIVYICASKLVQCAFKIEKYDFREVSRLALGPTGCHIVCIMLAVVQFSFTIAQISFTLKAIQSVSESALGQPIDMWWIALVIMAVYTPIAWVRRISVWAKGYSLAIMMIVFTTVVIMTYSIKGLI